MAILSPKKCARALQQWRRRVQLLLPRQPGAQLGGSTRQAAFNCGSEAQSACEDIKSVDAALYVLHLRHLSISWQIPTCDTCRAHMINHSCMCHLSEANANARLFIQQTSMQLCLPVGLPKCFRQCSMWHWKWCILTQPSFQVMFGEPDTGAG